MTRTITEKYVALYARVSTRGLGQDPEGQLIALREYAERRGWIVYREYVDDGYSGAKADGLHYNSCGETEGNGNSTWSRSGNSIDSAAACVIS